MKNFCLGNNLSDEGAPDLHQLVHSLIDGNFLPSNYAFTQDIKRSFQMNSRLDTHVTGEVTSVSYCLVMTSQIY